MAEGAEDIQRRARGLAARFAIGPRLGVGGMGTVFEARDLVRDELVALKVLRSADADALYRFKREFRALSDLSHPNLVVLYELFADEEVWAFSMELVRGTSLLEWLRPLAPKRGPRASHEGSSETPTVTQIVPRPNADSPPAAPDREQGARTDTRIDDDRLRDAMLQLARGLAALHAAGHVHRDVKPSNVLVSDTGRVVVLDFGIIAELGRPTERRDQIVGTPAYMAPEQAFPVGLPQPASDWYSFGVVLYEALAGRRPFLGTTTQLLVAKREIAPPPIFDFRPDAPPDLVELCRRLLSPTPEARPTGAEVIDRLSGTGGAAEVSSADDAPAARETTRETARVVGRERERAELAAAFAAATEGRPRALLVGGVSGIGKTALVEAFLEDGVARDAIVLRGRCYARESVPYKALDSLVDELCRWLTEAPEELVGGIIPADVGALTEVFPVLRRVPSFARSNARVGVSRDEAKRRAVRALRQLIRAVTAHRPVIAFVDDMQWGDLDSAPLFAGLLAEKRCRLLLLGTFRSDEAEGTPLLGALRESARGSLRGVITERILDPLVADDIRSLAREALGARADSDTVERIVAESGGSPYYALELARHTRAAAARASHGEGASIHALLRDRATGISEEARKLLETVVIAGAALDRGVIERAAALSSRTKAFVELVTGHFVKVLDGDRVDAMHDAVREAIVADMPESAQREAHRALAAAIEAEGGDRVDVHRAAQHWFFAFPDAPADKVFAVCYEAGRRAFASHAYDQAFAQLDRARVVAEAASIPIGDELHRLCADAAARTGQVEAALAGLTAALSRAGDPIVRADLHLARSKVHLAQLDTRASLEDIGRGLAELGERPLRGPAREVPVGAAKVLARALATKLGRGDTRAVDERQTERQRLITALWFQHGTGSYFSLDRAGQLTTLVRVADSVTSLGPSLELVRAQAMCGLFLSLFRARDGAEWFRRASERTADRVGTDAAKAIALMYRAHGLNFAGDPVAGERTMRDCLETYAHVLDNVDFHLLVSHLAGMLMARGHAREAMRWIDAGLERATLESRQGRLDNRHTYAGTAAVALAMLGRPDEGRHHLDTFGALVGRSGDRWRRLHWIVHRLSFLVECGVTGGELEDDIRRFEAMGITPPRLPVQFRHAYVAIAKARLAELDGASGARSRYLEARADLARAATHPSLRTKLLRLDAAFASREGDHERAAATLTAALELADSIDDRAATWEIHVERARCALRRKRPEEAEPHLARAESVADEQGWLARLEQTRAMRSA